MSTSAIPTEKLLLRCDLSALGFETTAELADVGDILGQGRAYEAVRFGIGIRSQGHNLFVMGPSGTGKYTTVKRLVSAAAATERTPSDWCYVNNFEVRHKPVALELPAGRGRGLRRDMEQLVENLKTSIRAVVEAEEYRNQRESIDQEFKDRQEQLFESVQKKAAALNVAMVRTPMGLALAPIKDDEVVTPEEFKKLPKTEREKIEKAIEGLQQELKENLQKLPQWD
jgi:hypothetical protein